MKATIFFLLFGMKFFTSGNQPQKVLIEKISIGKFYYLIYKEKKILHDESINAEYFVVYKPNSKNSLCSSFMSQQRNDTIFSNGFYYHNNKYLIFKEVYFSSKIESIDSMIKIFYPNKDGDLLLKEVKKFKDGVILK